MHPSLQTLALVLALLSANASRAEESLPAQRLVAAAELRAELGLSKLWPPLAAALDENGNVVAVWCGEDKAGSVCFFIAFGAAGGRAVTLTRDRLCTAAELQPLDGEIAIAIECASFKDRKDVWVYRVDGAARDPDRLRVEGVSIATRWVSALGARRLLWIEEDRERPIVVLRTGDLTPTLELAGVRTVARLSEDPVMVDLAVSPRGSWLAWSEHGVLRLVAAQGPERDERMVEGAGRHQAPQLSETGARAFAVWNTADQDSSRVFSARIDRAPLEIHEVSEGVEGVHHNARIVTTGAAAFVSWWARRGHEPLQMARRLDRDGAPAGDPLVLGSHYTAQLHTHWLVARDGCVKVIWRRLERDDLGPELMATNLTDCPGS